MKIFKSKYGIHTLECIALNFKIRENNRILSDLSINIKDSGTGNCKMKVLYPSSTLYNILNNIDYFKIEINFIEYLQEECKVISPTVQTLYLNTPYETFKNLIVQKLPILGMVTLPIGYENTSKSEQYHIFIDIRRGEYAKRIIPNQYSANFKDVINKTFNSIKDIKYKNNKSALIAFKTRILNQFKL